LRLREKFERPEKLIQRILAGSYLVESKECFHERAGRSEEGIR